MSYLVLARKYRPTTFDEVIGQESTAATLKNAVTSGRVAHAYLFTGPRGVGKTTMARILAKALNCEKGPTQNPCNKCSICKSIDTGDDIDVIEVDGASNRGIDPIRSLRDNARYAPARARHKIYIIDEVHMLTNEAFNALLKILEEPPPHVKFIFATTEPHKLIDTIRSRCQRFDFRRIPASRISEHLAYICKKEKIKADDGVLDAIARSAHGGMRDAESLLDQLAALAADKISAEDLEQLIGAVSQQKLLELLGAIAEHDPRKAVELADDALARGAADDELIQQLIEGFRELLLARIAGADSPLIDRGEAQRRAIGELASKFTIDGLMYLVQMFAETKRRARDSSQSRVVLELALIKAAEVHKLRSLDEILAQLRGLESGGSVPQGGGARKPRPPATSPPKAEAKPPAPPPKRTGNLWADALALLEQRKAPLATFMAGASFRPAAGPVLAGRATYIIELDPIGVEQAKANQKLIESVVSEVSGNACSVELHTSSVASQPAGAPKPPRRIDAQPKGKHVKKAMDLFNARVVATNKNSGRPRVEDEGI